MQEKKVWVYLTQRNKKGVRFLSQFKGKEAISPTRMSDFSNLGLQVNYVQQLDQVVYDSRLLWESWIETAESFDEMTTKLKKERLFQSPYFFHPRNWGQQFCVSPHHPYLWSRKDQING